MVAKNKPSASPQDVCESSRWVWGGSISSIMPSNDSLAYLSCEWVSCANKASAFCCFWRVAAIFLLDTVRVFRRISQAFGFNLLILRFCQCRCDFLAFWTFSAKSDPAVEIWRAFSLRRSSHYCPHSERIFSDSSFAWSSCATISFCRPFWLRWFLSRLCLVLFN